MLQGSAELIGPGPLLAGVLGRDESKGTPVFTREIRNALWSQMPCTKWLIPFRLSKSRL